MPLPGLGRKTKVATRLVEPEVRVEKSPTLPHSRFSDLVDLSTAARVAGISRQAVSQHAEAGHLHPLQVGRARFIRLAEVEQLVTQYAMTGRKPLRQKAVQKRQIQLQHVAAAARGFVRTFVALLRSCEMEVGAVKHRYRVSIKEASASRKASLQAERRREIDRIRSSYSGRLSAMHASRRKMLGDK